MKRSYLDYAMSVIVARALPDVRDGLKPVHRRILYSMKVNGNEWNRAYRKSARIVGDVIGKYHPHGELAIYDAMVRMAQDFAMRLPLIDGQGNFGSMDGDPPAAYRYTEARLARVADSLLDDLDNDTVDFQPNYDDTEREPKVLPAGFPNLLVNGAQGIAVGMATNIPPHNLGEVIDACCAYLDNGAITVEELMEYVPAPDFPTGGIIIGPRRHACRLQDRPGCGDPAGEVPCRGNPQGPRGARLYRDALSGQQGEADRAHRRVCPREADRGHRRAARRERPRRRARRRRAEARRRARHRAEPAVPPYRAADELWRQHAGAERRPARADDPARRRSSLSSRFARRSSPGAPAICSARRASARTPSWGC